METMLAARVARLPSAAPKLGSFGINDTAGVPEPPYEVNHYYQVQDICIAFHCYPG